MSLKRELGVAVVSSGKRRKEASDDDGAVEPTDKRLFYTIADRNRHRAYHEPASSDLRIRWDHFNDDWTFSELMATCLMLLFSYTRCYIGVTASPHWRAAGCDGYSNMVPHFSKYTVVFVITVEHGLACCHLEDYLIEEVRKRCRDNLDNAAEYRRGPVQDRVPTFLYVCCKE